MPIKVIENGTSNDYIFLAGVLVDKVYSVSLHTSQIDQLVKGGIIHLTDQQVDSLVEDIEKIQATLERFRQNVYTIKGGDQQ